MRKGSNRRTVKRRREVFLKKICINTYFFIISDRGERMQADFQ